VAIAIANAIQIPVTGSFAGGIPAANDIELFLDWMKPVEQHEQEVSQWLPAFSKAPNQVQFWTGQSYLPPIETTLEAATANNSTTVDTVGDPAALGFRVGDIVEIVDYFTGQQTYTIASTYERGRITTVNAGDIVVDRHSGSLSSGSWYAHPAGSRVRVVSRNVAYKTAFDNAPVWRGDSIYNVPQRIPTGFVRVDKAMLQTPTQESVNQFKDDIAGWRTRALDYREDAYINGIRVLPTETVAGQAGGMLWWASQVGANVLDLGGKQISIHHISDRIRLKRKSHNKKAGTTVICDLDTMAALDLVLEPYKHYDAKDNTIRLMFDGLETRWGNVTFMPVATFPSGTALITSKDDWEAGNYAGMDWDVVEQEEEHTGGPWVTWAMYGDFSLRCKDVYRQILIKNINTYVDRYAGRRVFAV